MLIDKLEGQVVTVFFSLSPVITDVSGLHSLFKTLSSFPESQWYKLYPEYSLQPSHLTEEETEVQELVRQLEQGQRTFDSPSPTVARWSKNEDL